MYYTCVDINNEIQIQDILEHAEIEETISRIAIHFAISSASYAQRIIKGNKTKQKTIKLKAYKSKKALELATREINKIKNELERNYQRIEFQKRLLELERTKNDMSKINVSILTESNNDLNSDLIHQTSLLSIQQNGNARNIDNNSRNSIHFEDVNVIEKLEQSSDDYESSMQELSAIMENLHESLGAINDDNTSTSSRSGTSDNDEEERLVSRLSRTSVEKKNAKMTCSLSSFFRWFRGSSSNTSMKQTLHNASLMESGVFSMQ